jgi:predicted nucleic acid-binding Zn ribbon protein
MSKYERYKKQSVEYIYPHKHCKKCEKMIDGGITYCSECYNTLQERKRKKWYKFKKKKKETDI